MGVGRGVRLAIGVMALLVSGAAGAQENLDHGKTPAQLFAANCAVCHKSPQGLVRPGASGLDTFLRQHYSASRETAAVLAGYLQSAGPAKKNAKGEERPKGAEKKPKTARPGETKPGEAKPGEAKPADAKSGDAKTIEPKSSAPESSDPKPSETKASAPSEAKPAEPKSDKSD